MTTYAASAASLLRPEVLLLAKVTLLIALAGLATTLLHRRSAALRHSIWALSLAGAIAVVAVDRVLPQVDVSLRRTAVQRQNVAPPAPLTGATTDLPDTRIGAAGIGRDADLQNTSLSLIDILVCIWITGGVLVVARYAVGHAGLSMLTRRARSVGSDAWHASLASAKRDAGVHQSVQLAVSADVGAPVTWGHRAPVVLIPQEALDWDAERRRVVLLHELAHIARRDYLVQLAASIVCAVYWFHPLVWVATRRLRTEAERACDDRVLYAGTTSADYAAHLLDVARGARTLRLTGAVAIGMARHSTLEGRMLAIIDSATSRAPVSGASRRMQFVVLSLLVLAVGVLRPVETRAEIVTSVNVVRPRAVPSDATPAQLSQRTRVMHAPAIATSATVQRSSDSTFTKSVPASPGGTLTVDLRPGGSIAVHGWNQNRVEMRARMGGRDWRDVTVELRSEGDGVGLRTFMNADRRNMSTSIEFDVYVPARYNVRLASGGGTLALEGIEGDFSGSTGGGTIQLDRLSGNANLSTGGGTISVTDSNLDGLVSTGGGQVAISNNRGNLRGSSGSDGQYSGFAGTTIARGGFGQNASEAVRGAVRAAQGGRVSGRAGRATSSSGGFGTAGGSGNNDVHASADGSHITRAGGDITIERAPNGAVATTGGGNVHVGNADGDVHVTTGGGTVHVGPARGSVHATTGRGDVDVELAETRENNQSVTVISGTGRVVVEVPRGFRGTLDLETAYTENAESPRIILPWNLRSESTPNWDRSQGTPRRYVRVNGSVGGGGDAVIRVRTVNGDIEIRQK